MGGSNQLFHAEGILFDGILLLMLDDGLIGSLFLHLVKAPEWRARAKAMKEFEEDKADASNESEEVAEETLDEEANDEVEEEEMQPMIQISKKMETRNSRMMPRKLRMTKKTPLTSVRTSAWSLMTRKSSVSL